MLNKNQSREMEKEIVKGSRDIFKLIKEGNEEGAYIKYDTMRNMTRIFDMENVLDEQLEYYLIEKGGYNKILLESFKASFIDYKTGEVFTVKFNENLKIAQ